MRPYLIAVGVGALIASSDISKATAQDERPSSPSVSRLESLQRSVFPQSSGLASSDLSQPEVVTLVAQTSPSSPSTPSPAASPAPSPASNSTPNSSNTDPTPGTDVPLPTFPIGPAKPGQAPEYLNPDSNPLQRPTQPSEVRLQGIQPITLEQAIDLARRNNRTLQVSELQLRRSQAGLREAQADNFPSLNLQTGLSRSQSASGQLSQRAQESSQSPLSALLGGNQNSDRASSSLTGTVELSYNLFTFGARPARIRSAERQVRFDQLQVEVTLEQLRLDVTNDYYDLQEADESVRINTAAVRNAEVSLRDTQALERAGLGTRADVLRAQVQLANARQQLTNSIASQQTRRRQLAQRLSISQFVDLAAADPVQAAGNWNLPLEDSIILAFKNRAELEQLLVQRELSDQQRRAALAALRPTVNVSAQYNILNSLDDEFGFADGYSLSAGIRWNLYDGGAAVARARQQEANIAIAETRFADTRNQVRFQVEQAYANLRSGAENIQTSEVAVGQARESLRLARLRFQAGVGTQLEVTNAETDLTRAESNRITAILGYNRALALLQRAVTNLTIPAGATTPIPPAPSVPLNAPTP